ncbi:MAG: YhcN/YlaJ family sporulation lipoprotein [Clostridia bacterium]|nr:YhcN/YlaJ family sporulation lipoprotein [Clostridia bacterium]
MRNTKKVLALVLILGLILSLAISCTPQQRPAPNNDRTEKRQVEINDRERDNLTENNNQKKASQLAERITDQIQGINAATVILANGVAYVGIDLNADYSGNKADDVKKETARLVKEYDADIDKVFITEDADTFTRMREIARDIENGKPLTGFLDELHNMFRRVTPSMD